MNPKAPRKFPRRVLNGRISTRFESFDLQILCVCITKEEPGYLTERKC
ncbi:hypothetical protein DSM110093_03876 (plasmid) [Sulfitobacter sp. DSM 110093]|nr:hypothetical protein DSM110093_03615 [Sulfitobacter sp. DSM 110093]UOA34041.1 hypothetical protein DSM110093_03876 [Sulfitobacter sp. DSM 110093]